MYDSFLSILAIVLIPVLLWWRRQPVCTKTKYLGYFLILFFLQGSLQLVGFNQTLIRYLFELPLIAYFLYDITKNGIKRTPGGGCVLLFMLYSIPSVIFTSAVMYVFFLQEFLLVWIMFYCFYHANWTDEDCDSFNQLFIGLCVSQFFAAILKYLIIGICEPYIGTMASHSGGLTTLFSLAGFATCSIMYFCTKGKKFLWGCLGFVLFGLIGEKRALVFMIPASLLVSFLVYSVFAKQFGISFIKKIIAGVVLVPLLFYVMVRVNPSFNPERKVWGPFDLEYTLNYAKKYNSGTLTNDDDNVGRSEAHAVFHAHIMNDNLYHILFGYGSGLLVQSRFNHEIKGSVQDYSFNQWGVGYSISIGYLKLLAQVGFVGLGIYFMIYISLLRGIYHGIIRQRANISETFGYGVSAFIIILIMLLLSITYNNSSFTFNPVSVWLMWLISYSYKQLYSEKQ